MSLIDSSDLTWMADVQQQAMPGTIVIERYTLTNNGAGASRETWPPVGTVIGRIYPMVRRGQAEAVAGAQIVSATQWFATLPVGTTVTAKDRLTYNSRSWEVLRVNNSEMYQTAVRCELEARNEERRT